MAASNAIQTLDTSFLSLVSINNGNLAIKLTPTNYSSWRFQFDSLLIGYDLMGFIDRSRPCPPKLTTTDVSTTIDDSTTMATVTPPNPAHNLWICQDRLILSAITGSVSLELVPFISTATTSREAWQILANTYARPSHVRINQLKQSIRLLAKDSRTVTEYMQFAKVLADELALLNQPLHPDDLVFNIINGLPEEYSSLASALRARDTCVSFDELYEKLINFEADLKPDTTSKSPLSFLPATANLMQKTSPTPHSKQSRPPSSTSYSSSNSNPSQSRQFRPYKGKCQLCWTVGHSTKFCPSFTLQPAQHQRTRSPSP